MIAAHYVNLAYMTDTQLPSSDNWIESQSLYKRWRGQADVRLVSLNCHRDSRHKTLEFDSTSRSGTLVQATTT